MSSFELNKTFRLKPYHNGAIFSVFTAGEPSAIGNGGRYDGIGKAFGRSRPATGFTFYLRQLDAVLVRT